MNKKQHVVVRAPITEKSSANQSYILSFEKEYHAEMFRLAVSSRRRIEKKWPQVIMNSDYSVDIFGPVEEHSAPDELEVDKFELPNLSEECNLNGILIGLVHDFKGNDSRYRFRGSKITQSKRPGLEDYRTHFNKILER